jgi:hypothetical protein
MTFERWPQILTLCGGVVYVLLTTVHHIFRFEMKWMESILPHLTLIVCLLILGILLEQQVETSKLRKGLTELSIEGFSASHLRIDKELRAVFGDELSRRTNDIVDTLKTRSVRVETEGDFRTYYNKALEIHPKSTFYATSLASEAYFWKPGTYEEIFRQFMRRGGSMKRIFFMEHDHEQLSEEERRVVNAHARLGVDVFVISRRLVPAQFNTLFIVESKGRISWVSEIDATAFITRGVASADRNVNEKLVHIFEELCRTAHHVQADEVRTRSLEAREVA